MDIPGVPDSISREAYVAMVASLGLDAHEVRKLEFRIDGVFAEVKARSTSGVELLDMDPSRPPDQDEAAVHRLFIPIKDE